MNLSAFQFSGFPFSGFNMPINWDNHFLPLSIIVSKNLSKNRKFSWKHSPKMMILVPRSGYTVVRSWNGIYFQKTAEIYNDVRFHQYFLQSPKLQFLLNLCKLVASLWIVILFNNHNSTKFTYQITSCIFSTSINFGWLNFDAGFLSVFSFVAIIFSISFLHRNCFKVLSWVGSYIIWNALEKKRNFLHTHSKFEVNKSGSHLSRSGTFSWFVLKLGL